MAIEAPAIHRLLHQCRFCSKWRRLEEFIGGEITGQCVQCLEWHRHALDVLTSGAMPRGCRECGATADTLSAGSASGDFRLYLHRKDGIYQLLCWTCSDAYERKRLDQFGDTPYGAAKHLKGAH